VSAEPRALADDTSIEAERHQLELWRHMTPAQKGPSGLGDELARELFPEVENLAP
jgi:hypothetical protein